MAVSVSQTPHYVSRKLKRRIPDVFHLTENFKLLKESFFNFNLRYFFHQTFPFFPLEKEHYSVLNKEFFIYYTVIMVNMIMFDRNILILKYIFIH